MLDELGAATRQAAAVAPEPQDLFSQAPAALPALDDNERKIADVLTADPLHLDEIATHTGLSPARVAAAMIPLQLKGVAKQLPGGHYVKPTRPT